jgi:hypothetical protein
MLKLIAHSLLSFIFVLVMMMQVVPHATAAMPSDTSMSMDGMDMSNCDHSGAPCKGMTPACIDSMGCATIAALPTTPLLTSAPLHWAVLSYGFVDVAMNGRTIRPELFPPILRA